MPDDPSAASASPDSRSGPVTVDLSAVGTRALRGAIREALDAAALGIDGASIHLSEGAFEADSWLDEMPTEVDRVLLVADLTALDRAITPNSAGDWLARIRAIRTWVVAFVRTGEDRARAHRTDGILRALDGRLTVLPEPEGGKDRIRQELQAWFVNILHLLEPGALLEARPAGAANGLGPALSLRFGDDWAPLVPLDALWSAGIIEDDGAEPRIEAVASGPGGRSLRLPLRGAAGSPLQVEAGRLRRLLEEAGIGRGNGGLSEGTEQTQRPQRTEGPEGAGGTGGEDHDAGPPDRRPHDPMPMGDGLRQIRLARGLSQSELGEMAGLHQSVISNLERSVHSPRLETLRRVAVALELRVPGLTGTGE